jgi:hypothetical protein
MNETDITFPSGVYLVGDPTDLITEEADLERFLTVAGDQETFRFDDSVVARLPKACRTKTMFATNNDDSTPINCDSGFIAVTPYGFGITSNPTFDKDRLVTFGGGVNGVEIGYDTVTFGDFTFETGGYDTKPYIEDYDDTDYWEAEMAWEDYYNEDVTYEGYGVESDGFLRVYDMSAFSLRRT